MKNLLNLAVLLGGGIVAVGSAFRVIESIKEKDAKGIFTNGLASFIGVYAAKEALNELYQ